MEGWRERQRQEYQAQSVIAFQHAGLVASYLCGKKKNNPEVYEVFPFWTEEEVRGIQLEKYRNIMERYVARGGGSKSQANKP